jgi:phosphatidate cytidylyltransferase
LPQPTMPGQLKGSAPGVWFDPTAIGRLCAQSHGQPGLRLREAVIKSRIITGALLLPMVVAFVLWAPVAGVQGLACVLAGRGLYEFYHMALPASRKGEGWLALVGGALLVWPLAKGAWVWFQGGLLGLLFALALLVVLRCRPLERSGIDMALLGFGFLYITLPLGYLGLLRALPHGERWILLVLLLVMSSDTAAYFTGINFGRRKLYPIVSPNKSVEGAVGGLLGCLLAALVAQRTFFPYVPWPSLLVLGVLVGVVAPFGDLFESLLKRCWQVKDSGTLLPGHGGLLDRLDSLLFVFPLVYYFALIVIG